MGINQEWLMLAIPDIGDKNGAATKLIRLLNINFVIWPSPSRQTVRN